MSRKQSQSSKELDVFMAKCGPTVGSIPAGAMGPPQAPRADYEQDPAITARVVAVLEAKLAEVHEKQRQEKKR
jgi:hypothetical protein